MQHAPLEDKRILVTGGARGIGAAIVREAMGQGAEVAFTYLQNKQVAQDLAHQMEIAHDGQRCLAIQADVADAGAMEDAFRSTLLEFERIDALVCNAGITRDAMIARMTPDEWDSVITTNLGGVFNTVRPVVPQFVKQRTGAIVTLTSIVGIYGSSGQSNYAASKAGIIGLTKALAKELAPLGVRVNAVAPGFVETDMLATLGEGRVAGIRTEIPLSRLGTVDEVADAVCFLASDRASYITGHVLEVSGGLTL